MGWWRQVVSSGAPPVPWASPGRDPDGRPTACRSFGSAVPVLSVPYPSLPCCSRNVNRSGLVTGPSLFRPYASRGCFRSDDSLRVRVGGGGWSGPCLTPLVLPTGAAARSAVVQEDRLTDGGGRWQCSGTTTSSGTAHGTSLRSSGGAVLPRASRRPRRRSVPTDLLSVGLRGTVGPVQPHPGTAATSPPSLLTRVARARHHLVAPARPLCPRSSPPLAITPGSLDPTRARFTGRSTRTYTRPVGSTQTIYLHAPYATTRVTHD